MFDHPVDKTLCFAALVVVAYVTAVSLAAKFSAPSLPWWFGQ